MKATVIPQLCNGCRLCVRICPQAFRLDNGKATVFVNPIPREAVDDCKDAALLCLSGAIKIDEAGEESYV